MHWQPITVSTIIVTYRRDDALKDTLERLLTLVADRHDHEIVLVDNNADSIDRETFLSAFPRSRYVPSRKNLGVAAGRNLGLRTSEGEVVVFLDDDALLEGEKDFYDQLQKRFRHEPALAAIAFRSWLREPGVSDPIEFPHTDKTLSRDEPFETFRFIGVGHALLRRAVEDVGNYCESFFYGMEEFEMCFRLLDRGWRIRYDPAFTVTHMKSPSGRLPSRDVMQRMFTNKLCIAWMHLPFAEMAICAGAWAVKTFRDSRSPSVVLGGLIAFTKIALSGSAKRQPKSYAVIRIGYLGGSAWR